jgi:hypothetical protein
MTSNEQERACRYVAEQRLRARYLDQCSKYPAISRTIDESTYVTVNLRACMRASETRRQARVLLEETARDEARREANNANR